MADKSDIFFGEDPFQIFRRWFEEAAKKRLMIQMLLPYQQLTQKECLTFEWSCFAKLKMLRLYFIRTTAV